MSVFLDDVGLKGVKDKMLEEFGPHGHVMRSAAREHFLKTTRRFRERFDHYFQRYDMNELEWQKLDPDYVVTDETKAQQVLWQSGLTRTETDDVFKIAFKRFADKDRWESKVIRDVITEEHAHTWELDIARVMKSYKNKHHSRHSEIHLLYQEDKPEIGQAGTELTWEDVYEAGVEAEYDLSSGFDPANPINLGNEA